MAWSNVSRHLRGYGNAWDRKRKQILQRDNGLCQCDECKGGKIRITAANEVHHVVSKAEAALRGWSEEQTEADDNLISINSECHKRETFKEQGKTLRMVAQIGADGWPIE
jgi:5-methylcytosine-specific restriction enzyme A